MTLDKLKEQFSEFLVDLADFEIQSQIGKGGFGVVSLAIDKRDQKKIALKSLNNLDLKKRQLEFFAREVSILSTINNPFLLKFVGFTVTPPFSILTEYIPNGSLYRAMHSSSGKIQLTGTQKTLIAAGIAIAMESLHKLGIIHRDLKSANVLLGENYYPVVCDFGISRFAEDNQASLTQQIGTPNWMAPEIVLGTHYDNKVDVYSYAIVLWELLTEQIPFKGLNNFQVMEVICHKKERPAIPSNAPVRLAQAIKVCWNHSPHARPTFTKIIKLFKKHKVAFEGTDKAAVDKFFSDYDLIKPKEKEEMDLEKALNILSDVNHPSQTIVALRFITDIIQENSSHVKTVFNSGIITKLPLNVPGLLGPCLNLLFTLQTQDPLVVDTALFEQIVNYIDLEPLRILRIFDYHFENCKKEDWGAIDCFFGCATKYREASNGANYIKVMGRMLSSLEFILEYRSQNIIDTLFEFTEGEEDEAIEAVKLLIKLKPATHDKGNGIWSHLKSSPDLFLSFLSICQLNEVNENAIHIISDVDSKFRIHAILCQSRIPGFASLLLDQFNELKELDRLDLLKILLVVSQHESLKQKITESAPIHTAIVQFCSNASDIELKAVGNVLLRLPDNKDMIKSLDNKGFFKTWIESIGNTDNESFAECGIKVIVKYANTEFIDSFLELHSIAVNLIDKYKKLVPHIAQYFILAGKTTEGKEKNKESNVLHALKGKKLNDDIMEQIRQVCM